MKLKKKIGNMERNNNFKVSVVVPIFNEEGNIAKLVSAVASALPSSTDCELLFVDDGSTDNTLIAVKEQRKTNKNIKYISFSRNFGHQSALRAGLDFATGDCVISMDGDMQHPPTLIPELIEKWQEGYDIVYTKRLDDPQVSYPKRKTANIFYWTINKLSDIKLEKGVADFRLLDRSVVDVLKTIKENDLFMRGAISWIGFRQFGIEYMPEKRNWGKTKYTLKKMIRFAISGITGFSVRPLQISIILGFVFSSISFIYGLYAIGIRLFTNNSISGWASVLAAILFIGGVQMIMLGILGEYIGRLFLESKKRPNYVIKEQSE